MTKEGSDRYAPMFDGNGNVMGQLKLSDGFLRSAYEYDAFGQTLRESGTYAASNPWRFSTKYTDVETGEVNYGLRVYLPSLGRFANKDPLEEKGGLNLYGFVRNNAINHMDYLGMDLVINLPRFNTEDIYRLPKMVVTAYRQSAAEKGWIIDMLNRTGRGGGSAGEGSNGGQARGSGGGNAPSNPSNNPRGNQDENGQGGETVVLDTFRVTPGPAPTAPEVNSNPVAPVSAGGALAPNSGGSLTLGDKVRIAMGVANAVSPNPVAGMIDKGVAVGQMTGSVSAGINAAINPVYGVLEGGYQNITGRSLHPDSPQATLTFGQRVLSGISAELNLVSTVGVGTLGAKLLSPSLPPLLFEGPTPGLQYGNGRVFQFRVEGQSPLFRVDYQPIPGSGSQSILHIDSPPLNISHLPITTPPPPPSTPVPPIF